MQYKLNHEHHHVQHRRENSTDRVVEGVVDIAEIAVVGSLAMGLIGGMRR